MSTDITVHQPTSDLSQQMEFARAVVAVPERGGSSILPEQYRGNPANVLIAVGLGASMGLSPAESLYRISVIKGKPSAGAELIAANVRKAGHKLRVRGDENSCTATIVRADDPDYEFTVTRDLDWARRMGLSQNDNYKKQPGTMLQWRAITAVARLACPEALYGVTYTPDEAREVAATEQADATATRPTAEAFRADVQDAEVVTEEPPAEQPADFPAAQNRLNAMFAEFGRAGFTTDARSAEGRQARLDYCSNVIGRPVESSKDLLAGEVERVINALKADAADDGELPLDPA